MKNVAFKTSAFALIMCSVLTYPALAQAAEEVKPPPTSNATPTAGPRDKAMRQFSQAGHSAMINIGDARLAIFNGEPKAAMKLMESAKTFLAQADKDAPSTGGLTTGDNAKPGAMDTMGPKMRSVPVDGQLALADDFVMTPEKKVHVDKANESFKKGDHATGLEELRLGAIDVNYTRWWLPIAQTETHLEQAMKLANESKYYEANLALKAIEDSVTMDSISFSDLPAATKSAKTKS
jgi:hypothetical protein